MRREARGDEARGESGEGLKVERCTLNVGRQRGGVHRHVRPHWRVRPADPFRYPGQPAHPCQPLQIVRAVEGTICHQVVLCQA